MLSVKSLGTADSGISAYYESLSADDYYERGEEPPGQWHGRLAGVLGLDSVVKPGELRKLFEGFHPHTGEPLAGNAGISHKAGWDCTFSAPKSVSVLWALTDEPTKGQIAAAHDAAVHAGLDYLEKNAFTSRDRNGAHPLQGIIAATYQHSTSRELDPQLHSHCAIANLGVRGDGTAYAVDFDSRLKMAGGAIYRAELAHRLQSLGLDIQRDGKSFAISSVPKKLCEIFSKRRKQIEEQLQQSGFTSARASTIAALQTRKSKESIKHGILESRWQREADEAGYSSKTLLTLFNSTEKHPPTVLPERLTIQEIISNLTQNEATFTRPQLEAAIATEAQGYADATEIPFIIQRAIDEGLANHEPDGLVQLQENKPDSRRHVTLYTTRQMLTLEQEALAVATSRKQARQHSVTLPAELLSGLSEEQAEAVKHVTQESGGVACVRGLAGTGKSFMLGKAREAWEAGGFVVLGAALAGKAADGLQAGSGIQSQTLHSLLADIQRGTLILSDKHVVVLDEAGMVGTRQLHALLVQIQQSGAKAVLVGDPQQLQPIEAGGLFRKISEVVGHAGLSEIRRQENVEDREMIKHIIRGQAAEVIEKLSEKGQLRLEKDDQIIERMVKDWLENRDPEKPGESLMLAGTRADVQKLNRMAREVLTEEHRLHSPIAIETEHGERDFAVGERVIFTRNSKQLGVKNGQIGTLEKWQINPHSGGIEFTVRMDAGDLVIFDVGQYGHVDHGYAISVHKSQGVTADNVSVLLSESMTDREWSYVALSRHRKRLRVFVPEGASDELEAGLHRSRQKGLASDYVVKEVKESCVLGTKQRAVELEIE
jgi:Ti-type conjugative transfer relaxase TraA